MDSAVLISAAVMFFIAAAEISCLFICSKFSQKRYPLTAVIPLIADDDELPDRLEYILSVTERGASPVEHILLLDMGADEKQMNYCRLFCKSCGIAEIITCDEMRKKLSEIFAFQTKT